MIMVEAKLQHILSLQEIALNQQKCFTPYLKWAPKDYTKYKRINELNINPQHYIVAHTPDLEKPQEPVKAFNRCNPLPFESITERDANEEESFADDHKDTATTTSTT